MDKNKIIILVLVIAVIALAAALAVSMTSHAKEDTKLEIKSNSTLNEGDYIKVKLTDLKGNPISNQTINITITDKDKANSHYSADTDEKGVAKLKIDKSEGKYEVNCTYSGNDNYNGNNVSKKIKIENEAVEAETQSSSQSYSESDSSGSDDYVYSRQKGGYVKASGQWDTDSQGNSIYSYQGDDGVLYERYYDSNGKEINANDYYK